LGTHADNMADMAQKGRAAKGEGNSGAKLTEDSVREVFAVRDLLPQTELAEIYGVSQQQISRILRGETWAHLKLAGAGA
jgi:hypothetical protein